MTGAETKQMQGETNLREAVVLDHELCQIMTSAKSIRQIPREIIVLDTESLQAQPTERTPGLPLLVHTCLCSWFKGDQGS